MRRHARKSEVGHRKIRDAICGGRTSALYTEYVANLKLGEKLKFFDVVSEYPFCMFRMAYPVGHPTIYLEGDVDMPYKCCNKLMFPLCRTCAENMSKTDCHHSDEEREIVGTWCAPELQLARIPQLRSHQFCRWMTIYFKLSTLPMRIWKTLSQQQVSSMLHSPLAMVESFSTTI